MIPIYSTRGSSSDCHVNKRPSRYKWSAIVRNAKSVVLKEIIIQIYTTCLHIQANLNQIKHIIKYIHSSECEMILDYRSILTV